MIRRLRRMLIATYSTIRWPHKPVLAGRNGPIYFMGYDRFVDPEKVSSDA